MLPDGMKFEGQWINDRKHGKGRLTYSDGATIEGTWLNDRLNGLCNVKNAKGSKMVIYKDDMMIKSKQGLSSTDKCYVTFAIIFMIAFYGAIPLGVIVDDALFAIMSIWVIYCCWSSCCNKSTKFISGLIPIQQVYPAISAAIQVAPAVSMTIQNYHYVTRRVKTKNGYRTERRRVNTHRHTHVMHIPAWVDRSPPVTTLNYLEVLNMCRLRIKRDVDYSPVAKTRRDNEKSMVIRNHKRDVHYDFHITELIALGCSDHALVHNEKIGKAAWYANATTMWMLDFFMFGWIQRIALNSSTKEVKYELKKYIIH
jgi:hypothetical protein